MTFALALLTGLGVGSGGLYILYLTLVENTPQAEAQGMNLAFFLTAMAAATVVNIIKKRISGISALFILPTGAVGAYLGCRLAAEMNTRVLSVIFGIFVIASAFILLTNKGK